MLDCFPAYLDPGTAPPDLLDWLAGWVGLDAVRELPLDRRRDLVRRAAQLHSWRGTAFAVKELLQAAAGLPVELDEPGAAGWSVDAGSALPGSPRPDVVIRILVGGNAPEPGAVDLFTQLLTLVMPAHLPWRLELVR